MAWLAAWVVGGMIAGLKGCLLSLVSATLCACTVSSRTAPSGEKVYDIRLYYLAFLLGSLWAISSVFKLPPVLVVSAAAYVAALAVTDRVHVILWDSGMRFPWMAAPVWGVSVEAGLEARKELYGGLWKLLAAVIVFTVILWTLNMVVEWWQYMDMLYSTGVR